MIHIILQIHLKRLPDCRRVLIGKAMQNGLCFTNSCPIENCITGNINKCLWKNKADSLLRNSAVCFIFSIYSYFYLSTRILLCRGFFFSFIPAIQTNKHWFTWFYYLSSLSDSIKLHLFTTIQPQNRKRTAIAKNRKADIK